MNIAHLLNALPGAVAQGLIWGVAAIGIYITYRILDVADLTVDGSLCTGGAVCIIMLLSGQNVFVAMLAAVLAGMLAGLATGLFHTFMGIPPILSGILTQLSLYSVNLKIMGKANQAVNVDKYDLLVSLRYIRGVSFYKNPIFVMIIAIILITVILYWFFGTEIGCGPPAATPICPGPRASTPILPKCWDLSFQTGWWPYPAPCSHSTRALPTLTWEEALL